MTMSDSQADSDEDQTIFEHDPPIMLPPDAIEAIILLVVVSLGSTITLHNISLTHIFGILIFVLVAKLNSIMLHSRTLSFLARLRCLGDQSETCRHGTKARLTDAGEQILAWVSGVPPREKVLDTAGVFTDAGQQFQFRAGLIGALVTFVLIYNIVRAVYSKVYSTAKASATVAELDNAAACYILDVEEVSSVPDTGIHAEETSTRSNPLLSLQNEDSAEHKMALTVNMNPLRTPNSDQPGEFSNHKACCAACEALEIAQADWTEVVKQHEEVHETVLEENGILKTQMRKLQLQLLDVQQEMRVRDDRLEYLDVLLEEAGKQLGHEADV